MNSAPLLIVCMGVSGCGKSTVARDLAQRFELVLLEGDDYHSPANKAWMAAGKPLTDRMREPWIAGICDELSSHLQHKHDCVLAFSALRHAHRQRLRELGFGMLFLYLRGEQNLIGQRVQQRPDHFMPASLLASQFNAMQPPESEPDVVIIDIAAQLAVLLETCSAHAQCFLRQQSIGKIQA